MRGREGAWGVPAEAAGNIVKIFRQEGFAQ